MENLNKENLLRQLQNLSNKKLNFEGRLNELQNLINVTRDEYLKTIGQIDLLTSLLSQMDSPEANLPKPKAREIIKPNIRVKEEEKEE